MFYLSVNISSSNSIFWNTMESSLFVGANLFGFLWLFLPKNLYLHELTSQRTMKSVATHQHWPPQIKMIPLYQTFVPFAQIIIATPKIVLMLKNFVFISKILLKVNFKYKMNLWSVLCLKHWFNITEGVWEFSTNFISNTRCSFNQSSFWLCTCEPAYQK